MFNLIEKLINLHHQVKYDSYRNKYKIHPTFRFNGKGIVFYKDGEIICRENSYTGEFSSVQAYPGCKVIICKNCRISHFVQIYTQTAIADSDFSKDIPIKIGDVVIGDNCWIGAKVFINPGIKIEKNCVVGAHSVVTKDLPPHPICVGVPCKVIKFKSYLSEKEKRMLAKKFENSLSEQLKMEFNIRSKIR